MSEPDIPSLLVVDDDKDIRKIVNLTLTRLGGFHVVAAASGEEALELIQEKRFEAVILDMCMPQMDGETTLRVLHKLPNMQEVPVVLLTAQASFQLPQDLAQWGVKRVLEKPFEPVELNRQIKEILAKE